MPKEIYYCPELDTLEKVNKITSQYSEIAVFPVSLQIFGKIAYREGSDGLVLIAEPKYLNLPELTLSSNPLLIVLESVEKPGNLGAVMRTADAAGVDAVIICDPYTDLYNPNSIRSSVGCIFTRQIVAASSMEVMEWLLINKINAYASALTDNAKGYHLFDYRVPTAFIMGTEATGLSRQWLDFCQSEIIIPMMGIADSLNVSASTSILVFEALRQRNFRIQDQS